MNRTRDRCFFGMIAVLLLSAGAPTLAAQGAVPLWEPTVITQSGKFVVTRDIVGDASGPVIDIQAQGEVFIDGNGFEISSSDMTQPVIRVGTEAPYGLTITNLRIRGGMSAVKGNGQLATCWIALYRVIISDVAGSAVDVQTTSFEADGVIISGALVGFHLSGPSDGLPASASIRDSTIRADHGIHCTGLSCNVTNSTVFSCVSALVLEDAEGSQAETSQFTLPGSASCFNPQPERPGYGAHLINSPNTVIAYSTLTGSGPSGAAGGTNHGVLVDAMSDGSNITDNWIRGFGGDGIHMLSDDSTTHCNVVTGNDGHGIFLGGFNNLAEDNKVGGNATGEGLHFETSGHVYRGNILRNNESPIGGPGGADAIDGGGNIQ